uniref:Uncharacterized protein n=1 Tax=Octopus bimaculoides TaxID=37653 RepID=A0A0L8FN22_OCTBM
MSHGCPAVPHSIVNLNKILKDQQILIKRQTVMTLASSLLDSATCLAWWAHYGLLRNSHMCPGQNSIQTKSTIFPTTLTCCS